MTTENTQNNGDKGNGHAPDEDRTDNVIRIPTLAERDKLRREQEKQWRRDFKQQQKALGRAEPMINLPPYTKVMGLTFLIIHAAISLLIDPPQQYWLYETFGFKPAYYTVDFPGWQALAGPFTYMLLHGNWLHIAMNCVMLAAFGAGVEKWMGGRRMLALFILTGLAACLFQLILSPTSTQTMIGASGGVSGLFAAVMMMLYQQGRLGNGKYGMLPFAALWIGISFLFGLLGGPDGSAIAWAAHIGGFLAGLVLIKPVLKMHI